MDWLVLALAILTCIVVAVVWIREEISYRQWRDDARKMMDYWDAQFFPYKKNPEDE